MLLTVSKMILKSRTGESNSSYDYQIILKYSKAIVELLLWIIVVVGWGGSQSSPLQFSVETSLGSI